MNGQPTSDAASRGAQRTADNRKVALRLKAALTYKASLDPSSKLIAELDREIADLRSRTRSTQPPDAIKEDLMRSLAAAQITLERAESHLATAQARHQQAQEQVAALQAELDQLNSPPASLPTAFDMTPVASLFTQLRT
eukprot:3943203-Alexandrium_andersonii.AAC.1